MTLTTTTTITTRATTTTTKDKRNYIATLIAYCAVSEFVVIIYICFTSVRNSIRVVSGSTIRGLDIRDSMSWNVESLLLVFAWEINRALIKKEKTVRSLNCFNYQGRGDFNLSEKQLQQAFLLPHKVVLESYFRAFQYKVLNRILYTNEKLYKIGFISHKDFTFCKSEWKTLTRHLLYHCPFFMEFWKDFEAYWSVTFNEQIRLTLDDIVEGILKRPCTLPKLLFTDALIYL